MRIIIYEVEKRCSLCGPWRLYEPNEIDPCSLLPKENIWQLLLNTQLYQSPNCTFEYPILG